MTGAEAMSLASEAGRLASGHRESDLREAAFLMRRIGSAFEAAIDLEDERWARSICEAVECGLREEAKENREAALSVAKTWRGRPMVALLTERLLDELEPRATRLAAAAGLEGERSELAKDALIAGILSEDRLIVERCARVATGWRHHEIDGALYDSFLRSQRRPRERAAQLALAEALEGVEDGAILSGLVERLSGSDLNATALRGVKEDSAIAALLSRMEADEWGIEGRVATVLATSTHPAARRVIAEAIASDSDSQRTTRIASEGLAALEGEWDADSARLLAARLRRENPKEWLGRMIANLWPATAELIGVSSTTRWRCAKALAGCSHPEAIDALGWGLRHADAQLRETCARSLGGSTDAKAVSALLRALRDSNPEVRSTAAESLREAARERPEVALSVAELLRDPIAMVRMYAARGLIGCLERLPPEEGERISAVLAECVRSERSSNSNWAYNVRRACLSALEGTSSERALREICGELRHEHAEIRGMVERALCRAGDPSIAKDVARIFEAGDLGPRLSCLKALRGTVAVVPLCKEALGQGAISAITAASVLAETPLPDSKKALLDAVFGCEKASVASAVGGALCRFDLDSADISSLRRAMSHGSPFVRQAALTASAGAPSVELWDEISRALGDVSPEIRASACRALRGSVRSAAVRMLLEACRDGSPSVRGAALTALAESVRAAKDSAC